MFGVRRDRTIRVNYSQSFVEPKKKQQRKTTMDATAQPKTTTRMQSGIRIVDDKSEEDLEEIKIQEPKLQPIETAQQYEFLKSGIVKVIHDDGSAEMRKLNKKICFTDEKEKPVERKVSMNEDGSDEVQPIKLDFIAPNPTFNEIK